MRDSDLVRGSGTNGISDFRVEDESNNEAVETLRETSVLIGLADNAESHDDFAVYGVELARATTTYGELDSRKNEDEDHRDEDSRLVQIHPDALPDVSPGLIVVLHRKPTASPTIPIA
jgi:hypothetical protein